MKSLFFRERTRQTKNNAKQLNLFSSRLLFCAFAKFPRLAPKPPTGYYRIQEMVKESPACKQAGRGNGNLRHFGNRSRVGAITP